MQSNWNERDEIIRGLSKRDRRILYHYEQEHGRIFPGAIYKVIEDQKEIARERKAGKVRKKRK